MAVLDVTPEPVKDDTFVDEETMIAPKDPDPPEKPQESDSFFIEEEIVIVPAEKAGPPIADGSQPTGKAPAVEFCEHGIEAKGGKYCADCSLGADSAIAAKESEWDAMMEGK